MLLFEIVSSHRYIEDLDRDDDLPTTSRRSPQDELCSLLPASGNSVSLDTALNHLARYTADAYAVVADAVRARLFVVEFEAEPRLFPFREVMIRRL